jgi:glycosyltransferase involved in cell wall biosynthesis
MKLVIQIPCLNEEETLPSTLADLPREVPGFDVVEWLIIDDGSTDRTVEVAKANGVDHVVSHPHNLGLAQAFMSGLLRALSVDADVIVNTDADNQYRGEDIAALCAPIVAGQAQIVVGARPIANTEHFSRTKKALQRLGSWVVRAVSGTRVADAPSGFRAISREAALRLNVFTEYTYTLETIIQAGRSRLAICSVPIRTNGETRPSRLLRSTSDYVRKSLLTIVRVFVIYKPFAFFASIGSAALLAGFLLGLRYLWFMAVGEGDGHVPSLILASILLGLGFQTILIGFVADLLGVNRKLLEELRSHELRQRLDARSARNAADRTRGDP